MVVFGVDLCAVASREDRRWGVLSARYVRGDGSPAERSPAVGLFEGFGPNVHVQGGARLLALSTGSARLPGHPDACWSGSCASYGPGSAPPGFPQDNPSCPPSSFINDDIGLEVVLRAPTNATGVWLPTIVFPSTRTSFASKRGPCPCASGGRKNSRPVLPPRLTARPPACSKRLRRIATSRVPPFACTPLDPGPSPSDARRNCATRRRARPPSLAASPAA